jgi:hypothetical protein
MTIRSVLACIAWMTRENFVTDIFSRSVWNLLTVSNTSRSNPTGSNFSFPFVTWWY